MTDLPPGWVSTTLGEIAETMLGKMLDRRKDTGRYPKPYLRNVNVQWGRIDLDDVLTMDIPPDQQDIFELRPGDLLVCEGGEIGRCAIWQREGQYMAFQKALHRVRPYGGIDSRYIRYLLECLSREGKLLPFATGSTIKHLPQEQLRRIPVPLPPLDEQKRIVTALDDHLSRLNSAVELLEKSAARSMALFRRLLHDLATPADGEEWDTISLGDLAKSIKNGMFVSRPGSEPNGVPILRIGAVRPLNLDISDVRYSGLQATEINEEGYLLREGDLLFTRYNGNPRFVGGCAVVPPGVGPLTYPDKLIRVTVDRARVHPDFVAIACSFGPSREVIRRSVKTTAGQAGISGRDLKAVPISVPSLEEQSRRISMSAEYSEQLRRLNDAIESMRRRSVHLRHSLLMEAFAGRLVPQDPGDEAASVLLQRIKAEWTTAAPVGRGRRRGSRRGTEAAGAIGANGIGNRSKVASIQGQETVL